MSNKFSAINQQIALKTIKKIGFSVNAVWNGQEALDYLLAVPSPLHPKPDVILMDVQMPILDGYQATHLIRHHAPFSNLPDVKAIPIIAMTASAIQGDQEKCRQAGMDDYLAKPVKGKNLEKMLVKWALEAKKKDRVEESTGSHPKHSPDCIKADTSPSPPSESIPPSENNGQAKHMAATNALPGIENEGDRGMRRVEAEEKAVALRDDKLIAASISPYHTPPPSMNGTTVRPEQPAAALTEENVGKLSGGQDEGGYAYTRTQIMPPSNPSIVVAGPESSTSSTLGSLRNASRSGWDKKLCRNDSDCSQRTVTPSTSR